MYNTTYLVFSRSQDKWECNSDLTYPLFKLNGLQTTGRWPPKLQQINCAFDVYEEHIELAFLTADIFASFGVLPLLHLRAYTLQDATVYTCSYLYSILVILSFQQ